MKIVTFFDDWENIFGKNKNPRQFLPATMARDIYIVANKKIFYQISIFLLLCGIIPGN